MSISTIWEVASKAQTPTLARILAFAGSLRKQSYNRRILEVAAEGARTAGAAVDLVDLSELEMSLFYKEGPMSPKVQQFAERIAAADAILISVSENNQGVSAALKNAIDWTSKPNAWRGKTVATVGASEDQFGTILAQHQLRQTLAFLEANHLPKHVLVSHVHKCFTPSGVLMDPTVRKRLEDFGADLVQRIADGGRSRPVA